MSAGSHTARRLRCLALLALLGIQAAACQRASAEPVIRVVTTFTILADFARAVGGDQVEVHSLVGADADAHVYEPTPADLRTLAKADVLIVNGLGFDSWAERLRTASGFRGRFIVAATGVPVRRVGADLDPHAWQDLGNARVYVFNIATGLAAVRPGGSRRFAARAAGYVATLDAMDADFRRAFAALPAENRVIITSHDAFGYLGAAYGLTLFAPQGMSTDGEPSAAHVARLIRQIRAGKVKGVFLENIRDERLMRRIAEEGQVALGGKLYSDALGGPASPASTFIDMYRYNVRTLLEALRDVQGGSPAAR